MSSNRECENHTRLGTAIQITTPHLGRRWAWAYTYLAEFAINTTAFNPFGGHPLSRLRSMREDRFLTPAAGDSVFVLFADPLCLDVNECGYTLAFPMICAEPVLFNGDYRAAA